MTFSPDQIRRYSRHVLLPDVGGTGQSRLLASSVVVDGSGAAGRIAAAFLVASGVGTVTVDGALDRPVSAAAFPLAAGDVGRTLHDALAAALGGRNPDVRISLGDAPGSAQRLLLPDDADDLSLGAAFAMAGAATSALLHRLTR
jgi:molybdopterin/thiamine biosynthesis adenylyltransferase